MKIKNQSVEPPKPVPIPLPRATNVVELLAGPIMSFDEFETLCPEPTPPVEMDMKTNQKRRVLDHEGYQAKMNVWIEQKTAYMIIKSLLATDGLEWELVKLEEPDTWLRYREELEQSFTAQEVDIIIQHVYEANMPTERSQKEALERFTLSQEETSPEDSQSPEAEPDSTPSGELASVSE